MDRERFEELGDAARKLAARFGVHDRSRFTP
jgi:hypothetical protein